MKKLFERPEFEILEIELEDILTSSFDPEENEGDIDIF